MNSASVLSFIVGSIMLCFTFINSLTIETNSITPTLLRSTIIAAITSITLILVGFLTKRTKAREKQKLVLNGEEGFYISDELSTDFKNELAWGTNMLLTATPASTVLIYLDNKIVLRRGIITNNEFIPSKICLQCRKKRKYISLTNTKFYPGKEEFDNIVENLPSIIIFPLLDKGWVIIGGWSERCFSKSDELWMDGWTKKLVDIY